jgi:hypothetical protein
MSEQLLHLVLVTANPRIKVRVVPMAAGAHPALAGPFMFLGFADRKPVVFLESEGLSTLIEVREVVENYRAIRTALDRIALSAEESQEFLARLASEFDREAEERNHAGGDLA